MTLQMYDTVTVETVPDNPQAVAGYVGGSWPTYWPLVQRFPHARHLSIAVNAYEHARCLDVEPGDATPDQAPDWLRNYAIRSDGKPVLYASASSVDAVIGACRNAGIGRSEYLIWSAHYTYQAHICGPGTCGYPQADATQFTDRALNRNLDESVCSDAFFGTPAIPPDPHHYDRFPTGPFPHVDAHGNRQLNERAIVEAYDKALPHPRRNSRKLRNYRADLTFLRKRVWYEAHTSHPPSWGEYWRGWRWQELLRRTR